MQFSFRTTFFPCWRRCKTSCSVTPNDDNFDSFAVNSSWIFDSSSFSIASSLLPKTTQLGRRNVRKAKAIDGVLDPSRAHASQRRLLRSSPAFLPRRDPRSRQTPEREARLGFGDLRSASERRLTRIRLTGDRFHWRTARGRCRGSSFWYL